MGQSRQLHKKFGRAPSIVEAMESRRMLSVGHSAKVPAARHHQVVVHPVREKHGVKKAGSAAAAKPGVIIAHPGPQPLIGPDANAQPSFKPSVIRHFYGVDNITFNGVAGDGAGQTIAVIDAFHDPKFSPTGSADFATSDLHTFDTKYNLPDPPSFMQIPEAGSTSLPTTSSANWEPEEALDIEWAHAMAPGANLIVVECNSESKDDLVTNAVAAARAAGASVISMSYAFDDLPENNALDAAFTSTTTSTAFTAFAAAGDNGVAQTFYPTLSPYVVSVGGTKITTSDSLGAFGSEVTWNDSTFGLGATGGGIAGYETKPYYQAGETLSGAMRGAPDVAFDADPLTGVNIVDTSSGGAAVKTFVGGTSLSSPAWAGIVAIADQGRALLGLPAMNGYDTTLPRLYSLPPTDFHDITSGNNTYKPFSSQTGHTARVGYDLVTGLGSPAANLLVPDLAGGATVTGRVFVDANGDGSFDGADTGLGGLSVYLDLNGNGSLDPNEPTATTAASTGLYTFPDRAGGETAAVRLVNLPAGYVATTNGSSYTTSYGSTQTRDLGLFPVAYSSTTADQSYAVSLDPTGTAIQISSGGLVTDSAPKSLVTSLSFIESGTGSTFTATGINGNPVPSGGISVAGGGVDSVSVIGTPSADSFATSITGVTFGATAITFPAGTPLTVDPGAGTDSLVVNSGTTTIPAGPAGGGILDRAFSSLSINSSAAVVFAPPATSSDRTLALVSSLSISTTARIDLTANDMVIQNTAAAPVLSALQAGLSTGLGIVSSSASTDSTRRTTLGIATGAEHPSPFDGYTPIPTDVLLKFTYFGDANLDGKIDGSDYSLIDVGYRLGTGDWADGDFNLDGVIDGSDYTLIDNSFNGQGRQIA